MSPTSHSEATAARAEAASVAIVTPCFNAGSFLLEAVATARSQTHPNVEIVIVDDGSTDPATLRALDTIDRAGDARVIHQSNQGPAAARNAAIAATDAEYILPLDADDLIDPPYVERAVAVLAVRPDVRMVYCRADMFGDVNGEWGLPDFSWPVVLVHNLIFTSHLFRRADWVIVGGYDEGMRRGREDHDFVLRLLSLGGAPYRLEGRYFHYRRSGVTRNAASGSDRELLIETSARMLRNNIQLYADHADDLYRYIFSQQDAINDLRHRYQLFERIRTRMPRLTRTLRAPVRWLLSAREHDGRK